MSLQLIASYDDLIQLCGLDTNLAEKFSNLMGNRETTFDPYISCASNPDFLAKGRFFTRNGKICKRSLNSFDIEKYCIFFIQKKLKNLQSKEEHDDVLRNGFDAYRYLMAYEKEINEIYQRNDLNLLQKAALYFIETGSEEKELDYVKYLASYDDLSIGAVQTKPDNKELSEWLPECGKLHYETNNGREEILEGKRPLTAFFDATKYIASYPDSYDAFKLEDGSIDEEKATIAWFTFGAPHGFQRNQFSPMVYLANNPDVCNEDIYTNKKVDELKVAKLWLERFKDGIDLTSFDVEDFKESHELKDNDDPFKIFVEQKVRQYYKDLEKSKRLIKLPKLSLPSIFSCGSKSVQNTVSVDDCQILTEVQETSEEVTVDESPIEVTRETTGETVNETPTETVKKVEKQLSRKQIKKELKEINKKLEKENLKKELEDARKKLDELSTTQ